MYYLIQENTFREENYDLIWQTLDRMSLPYEIVKVRPFLEDFEFSTKRKDIFCFGSLKMARLSNKYSWKPGSLMNDNHDYQIYKNYYNENLLNYDSKIIKFGDEIDLDYFFARPCKDTKVFTGKSFTLNEWNEFKQQSLTNGHSTILDLNTEVQIASVKEIQKEYRFWIVGGELITGSQYRLGNRFCLSDVIDDDAIRYCKEMIKLFQLADAFVMDICLTGDEWKIIECGCINCAGFYKANIPKLIDSLENYFN